MINAYDFFLTAIAAITGADGRNRVWSQVAWTVFTKLSFFGRGGIKEENKNGRVDIYKNGRVDIYKNGRVDTHKNERVDTHKKGRVDTYKNGRVDTHENGHVDTILKSF